MQGGIHPDLPGTAYFDLAAEIKRRLPEMHVHAFSPMEVVNGASRTALSIHDWLAAAKEAGVDTLPGTAAEILDDDVRWILTKGKLPAATWVEVVSTAHRLGIRTSSTMMYGHVDTPAHWLAHLRLLRAHPGGHRRLHRVRPAAVRAPERAALPGRLARPGPTMTENRAVHAMARLLLGGAIDHVQTSWVKLGVDGTRTMLAGGADDLGGTLMEETISRMAGSRARLAEVRRPNSRRSPAAPAGPAAQRTTTYGEVPARASGAGPHCDRHAAPRFSPAGDRHPLTPA